MINTTIAKTEAAGQQPFEAGKVEQVSEILWLVHSTRPYKISLDICTNYLYCNCPQNYYRRNRCKHIIAVELFRQQQESLTAH